MNNQTNGDGSIQTKGIEAGRDVIQTIGMNYTEVKELVLDLFENNFPRLLEVSYKEANENIMLTLELLKSKIEVTELKIDKIKLSKPDTHYVYNEAITMIGRKGEKIDSNLLCNFLLEKISFNKEEYEIVLDEVLKVVPKLSKNHLDFLAKLTMLYDYSFNGVTNSRDLEEMNRKTFSKLIEAFEISQGSLSYLTSLGLVALRPYRVRSINSKVSNEILRNDLYFDKIKRTYSIDLELEKEKMPFTYKMYTEIGRYIDVELYELTFLGKVIAISHLENLIPEFKGMLEELKNAI